MIQSSESGGQFEYVSKGRDFSKNIIDRPYIKEMLNNSIKANKVIQRQVHILFYGKIIFTG